MLCSPPQSGLIMLRLRNMKLRQWKIVLSDRIWLIVVHTTWFKFLEWLM